jgi:hypothetical protein
VQRNKHSTITKLSKLDLEEDYQFNPVNIDDFEHDEINLPSNFFPDIEVADQESM